VTIQAADRRGSSSDGRDVAGGLWPPSGAWSPQRRCSIDVQIPTLVILAVLTLSLLARREGLGTLGFGHPDRPRRFAARSSA